ncbi:hypothetical protein IWQ60_001905 [Tieghemiomyces parasiticus]|uniref:BZIP domain-containing protein n=1 Tax=Tieghemiomyces parasiticus TaxID=78921 RepID=A0A9W8AIG8_9FUNG|nr:hypothetical protein IWQ60_001905 [Tieghemiomyces parasiticus]
MSSTTATPKFARILPHPGKAAPAPRRPLSPTATPPATPTAVPASPVAEMNTAQGTLTDPAMLTALHELLTGAVGQDLFTAGYDAPTTTAEAFTAQSAFDDWLASDLSSAGAGSPLLSDLTAVNSSPSPLAFDANFSGQITPLSAASPLMGDLTASPEHLLSLAMGLPDASYLTTLLAQQAAAHAVAPAAVAAPTDLTAASPASPAASTTSDEDQPLDSAEAIVASIMSRKADPAALEDAIRKRQHDFLESLPPEIALKRRRTVVPKTPILANGGAAALTAATKTAKKDSEVNPSDPEDPAALKRQKNTDAARRSRMRKLLRVETLESRVADLETENTALATKVAFLEVEKDLTKEKEATLLERIRTLEQQLTVAGRSPSLAVPY